MRFIFILTIIACGMHNKRAHSSPALVLESIVSALRNEAPLFSSTSDKMLSSENSDLNKLIKAIKELSVLIPNMESEVQSLVSGTEIQRFLFERPKKPNLYDIQNAINSKDLNAVDAILKEVYGRNAHKFFKKISKVLKIATQSNNPQSLYVIAKKIDDQNAKYITLKDTVTAIGLADPFKFHKCVIFLITGLIAWQREEHLEYKHIAQFGRILCNCISVNHDNRPLLKRTIILMQEKISTIMSTAKITVNDRKIGNCLNEALRIIKSAIESLDNQAS